MDQKMTCGWKTGTAQAGPRTCGRPAKAETDSPSTSNGLVCGTHGRAALAWRNTVTPLPGPDVRVGQVWEDMDKRGYGRHVKVIEVSGNVATVEQVSARVGYDDKPGRRTKIKVDRFRPTSTGYRLVTDVPKKG